MTEDSNNTVPGSSTVEPRTVNADYAGSNPAPAARKAIEIAVKLVGLTEAKKELDELEARALGLEKRIYKLSDGAAVLGK